MRALPTSSALSNAHALSAPVGFASNVTASPPPPASLPDSQAVVAAAIPKATATPAARKTARLFSIVESPLGTYVRLRGRSVPALTGHDNVSTSVPGIDPARVLVRLTYPVTVRLHRPPPAAAAVSRRRADAGSAPSTRG